jgi:hypothetical protein
MTELPIAPRPRAVTVAFWCWIVAAVVMIVGALLPAAVNPSLPVAVLGAGAVAALAGLGMAFVAGRTRSGEPRFRRAAIGLSLAIVIVVAVLGVVHLLAPITLLALLPLIGGTVSIRTPEAQAWFDGEGEQ